MELTSYCMGKVGLMQVEVRCEKHGQIIETQLVELKPANPENGPQVTVDYFCPVGKTECDETWFEVEFDG